MAHKTIPPTIKSRNDLTAEFLRSILTYDPDTGCFTWNKRTDVGAWWNGRYAGKPVRKAPDRHGHIIMTILNRSIASHRVAWIYMTGEIPKYDIDHINGVRTDNRWDNLRQATRQENLRNMKLRSTNKSGYKGVSWCKEMNKWRAQIRDARTNIYLGCFATKEEAYAAWCEAAKRIHGEFARFS